MLKKSEASEDFNDNMKPELIVFDFDGVMTDNRVLIDQDGREAVWVSRADGQGVNILREAGFKMIILSTESNSIVKRRGEKLKLHVIHNIPNKAVSLKKYCDNESIDLKSVLYVGNDINDLEAMKICGMKWAPQDAEPEIKTCADRVLKTTGGHGVVREMARILTNGK